MTSRRAGVGLLGFVAVAALCAPVLAPNPPDVPFPDRAYAPPMHVHVLAAGGLHAPFIFAQTLHDRLMREYRDDASVRHTLHWFSRGRLVSLGDDDGPLLLLGADALGRDVFARLLYGARVSLGVAALGVAGALARGTAAGGLAGSLGGAVDLALMWMADLVVVLPGAYLVLVLRGALPLRLSTGAVFWLMAALFAASAWPHVARGVRAIVAAERARDYAEAARAAGAGPLRLIGHLLPAARGFLGVETVLLLPSLLVAEATISVLGLGFPGPSPSWGGMLQEATNVSVLAGAPWLLAPAAALCVVALAVHLAAGRPMLTSSRS